MCYEKEDSSFGDREIVMVLAETVNIKKRSSSGGIAGP